MMAKRRRGKVQKDAGKWYLKFWGFCISRPEYKDILLKAEAEEVAISESIALLNKHLGRYKKHGTMYHGNVVYYPHSVQLIHVSSDGVETVSAHSFDKTISDYGQVVKNDSVAA